MLSAGAMQYTQGQEELHKTRLPVITCPQASNGVTGLKCQGGVLGVKQGGKHAKTEPCCSVEGQSCNARQHFRRRASGLQAGGLVFSQAAHGPLNMQCPGGLGLDTAPLYLKLGHIWGGAGPSIRAVLHAPRLVILAGARLVESPGEH